MSRPRRILKLGHHRASGQARVLIDGRHVYLGKYGSAEAEEKYRRIIAEYVTSAGATMPSLDLFRRDS